MGVYLNTQLTQNHGRFTTQVRVPFAKVYSTTVPPPTHRRFPSTMGILSLCADSARPPGITTRHKLTMNTTENNTGVQRQCAMNPTFFTSNDETHLSTTSYNNTTPLSYITPHSPMASLHVSSDLTTWAFCWNLLLLVCFTIATILHSHSKKKRISKSLNTLQSVFTAACHLLSLLMSLISMATLFKPNRKRMCIRRSSTKRKRKKYPLARPPGIRSKYGKTNTAWSIVYDPRNDTVLTWTNHRVRIYQRRGRRLFTYKGKSENTFPRHALPISGEWQGSNFIVTNTSHWTNPPTETLPQYCHTPASITKRNNKSTQMDKNKQEPATRPPSKNRTPQTDRPRKKKAPKRKRKKVSQMSRKKWQTQARQFITNWTSQQMDAYLAIPEVALDWNVEPG